MDIVLYFFIALCFLIGFAIWGVIAYAIGPEVRYVQINKRYTVNGNINVINQAPAKADQFVGGKALAGEGAMPNRIIAITSPAKKLPSGGKAMAALPERRQLTGNVRK